MKNYYEILGIEADAVPVSIAKAYASLAANTHPEKNKEADAIQQFTLFTEAYEVLKDKEKKAKYDEIHQAYFVPIEKGQSLSELASVAYKYKEYFKDWEQYGREKTQEYTANGAFFFGIRLLKGFLTKLDVPGAIAIGFIGVLALWKLTSLIAELSTIGGVSAVIAVLIGFPLVVSGYMFFSLSKI